MKIKKEIGWQKYEDTLHEQLNSPLIETLFKSASYISIPEEESYYEEEIQNEDEDGQTIVNISGEIANDIAMATNFDCWMGHTNFNITKKIKGLLDEVDGIEVLKVCSRYRFFIGIGKMFDFSDVRKSIEDCLIRNDLKNEH